MSSRFSDAFFLRLAAANGIDDTVPPTKLDGTEAALTASFKTVPVLMKDLDAYGIHFSTPAGSTLVGTLTILVSNEPSQKEQTAQADVNIANFVTLQLFDWGAGARAASKAIASGANAVMLGDILAGYRWVQLAFAFTSGSGSPKIVMQQKGYS